MRRTCKEARGSRASFRDYLSDINRNDIYPMPQLASRSWCRAKKVRLSPANAVYRWSLRAVCAVLTRNPARYSVHRKLDFPELDVKLLLRAIGVYPTVLEQEEQPGLISASRRRPRLNCRYHHALEWSLSAAYRRHHTAQYT